MKKIIISPFSKRLRPPHDQKSNPKNYPYWQEVVTKLRAKGYHVIQVGVFGEPEIGANEFKKHAKLSDLKTLLDECHGWSSVDNFFNHFATYHKRRGVVVFSKSDPEIFGYKENINLLKNRSYLRPEQFQMWEQCEYDADAFIAAGEVVAAIERLN